MDYNDQRPPRSARPLMSPQQFQDQQNYGYAQMNPQMAYPARQPTMSPDSAARQQHNISFQDTERGERTEHVNSQRQRTMPSAYSNPRSPTWADAEAGGYIEDGANVGRKKSLVRPDRERIEPGHRQWHYRSHAAQMEEEGTGRVGVAPSTTGNVPQRAGTQRAGTQRAGNLRRGKSLLAREEDVQESGLSLFKRGTTLRRKRQPSNGQGTVITAPAEKSKSCWDGIGPGPKDCWFIYCYIITCWIPPPILSFCGIRTPDQQRAWREKMGLLSIIAYEMAAVGFITFGFTETVCGTPPNRFWQGAIGTESVIIHGYDYDFSHFSHPAAGNMFNGQTNPLDEGGWNLAQNDASFMFQITNENCQGIITKASGSSITGDNGNLDWYFPCNIFNPHSSATNTSQYTSSQNCHVSSQARQGLQQMSTQGQVYYDWNDLNDPSRNLAVFESSVLDLDLLNWLSRDQVNYPDLWDQMKNADGTYNGKDLSMWFQRTGQHQIGKCLEDTILVGFIDSDSIGCVASEVVLYLSLVFIIGVVSIRFFMAVLFSWFFSWKLGNFPRETYEQRMARSEQIEAWSNDIYRPAPSEYRPNVSKTGLRFGKNKKGILPTQSRFTPHEQPKGASPRPTTVYSELKGGGNSRPVTTYGMHDVPWKRQTTYSINTKSSKASPPETPFSRQSKSTTSFGDGLMRASRAGFNENPCPFPLHNVVPQPPPDYEPFNFPLAHTICLVTAYSESIEGLRTTLDSLATTDYPNSHKLILVIADGVVKGAGNDMTTPDICLTMMKEFIIPPDEVEAHSYVAIADGHKRHNMAKVYAGFYDYDDNSVERTKQQRVPMVVVAKVGNPLERGEAKPGNRGKRDSQIVLMAFLQKAMFDERMTTFEYEFFNSVWRVTGVSPDRYELVLCVDADTKIFPDSLTRMVSCCVVDVEIMGLCGETKIANKSDNFVTMMQVFEYYISHHMTKAFEAMFGGVTCLPGCFSMYRIKAPKGDSGYWVPILANPDIVEHYSENVVDTLHKKNLLLLGEDRYLTTLLLKTFPRRKNMFCPQAVCKTIVPDTFRVLLSQRRRWINSTVHNLLELILVRDLCGTFCFSMQFVVGMELAGTLVLPAAISFTLYLIIISIIPGGANTTIPLVLLAIVLGLPGVLIVVTSRKIAYMGWMVIYLLSLPIWNGLLPAYSFWHFDDFSWGQTRKIAGDKGGDHSDKDGEFDSSHIVMKRWAEFERDRRWKTGMTSRDSTYVDKSNRYSMASNSEGPFGVESSTTESVPYSNSTRPRHDSNALLMLPAPLAMNRHVASTASASSVGLSRSSEDAYGSDMGSTSNQRLVPSPQDQLDYRESPPPRHPAFENQVARAVGNNGGVLRNSTVASQYQSETHNPFRPSEAHVASYEDTEYGTETEEMAPQQYINRQQRGISLSDNGPVPGPDGVRRVAKPGTRRPSSQAPPQNRYSRSSQAFNLPPGAAPPQHGSGHGF
ncbi:glycosyltransferase family 2 protein [Coniophora puteana RWD-64-598 SS2]|uniref:chitin synthase n=1 Tax=Coniophora puteana (strain RWD-64-598) TaxID=741705 RepID=A0A5M3N6W3_CONPW|nr:glycosyltransferase family 2 protein [Coniophora puteana RWD-64-598 SS2]EIW87179.1 glycosyltransferase family 2 protein [Coniophora puteana RWD-64-598 SS2]